MTADGSVALREATVGDPALFWPTLDTYLDGDE